MKHSLLFNVVMFVVILIQVYFVYCLLCLLYFFEFSDKICDQISDAILDAHLRQDPNAKVACEVITKTGMILVAGEVSSKANVDYQNVIRSTVKQIGYDDSSKGI